MSDIQDLLNFNERQQEKLNRLIEPLRTHLGIDTFYYMTIKDDGTFTDICSHHSAVEVFFENNWHLPMEYLVSPSNLKNGYTFLDFDPNFSKYQEVHGNTACFHNTILMIRKNSPDEATLFGYSSSSPNPKLFSLYMNHLPMLNKFFDFFIEEKCIQHEKMVERGINLLELRGAEAFYGKEYNIGTYADPMRNQQLLSYMGEDHLLLDRSRLLSMREKQVVDACIEGKTAAEIGDDLELSYRTIEHYLSNVKNKLGLLTKAELIQSGRLLKEAGLLDL